MSWLSGKKDRHDGPTHLNSKGQTVLGRGNPKPAAETRSDYEQQPNTYAYQSNHLNESLDSIRSQWAQEKAAREAEQEARYQEIKAQWEAYYKAHSAYSGFNPSMYPDEQPAQNGQPSRKQLPDPAARVNQQVNDFLKNAKRKNWSKAETLRQGAKLFHPDKHNGSSIYTRAMQDIVSNLNGWR